MTNYVNLIVLNENSSKKIVLNQKYCFISYTK